MSHAILGQSHLLDLVIRESAAPVRQVPGPRTGPSALDHAKGRNTRKSCDRCRRHKTKCDEGRPCRRCASKTIGQLCLDCDSAPDDAVWHDGSASTMVPHAPEFQSKAIVLPDQIAPLRAPTKSEIFAEQFGRGVWVNHNTSRKIVDGMPDELLEVVMESLEALRICKVGFCKENGLLADAAPKHSKGMVLKVLDDDYCADPVCVEEIYIGTCRTSGIFFNRRFAQEIMGCSADELLTRLARGDVGFSMTELESLCLLMDTHLNAHAMQYHKYHIISPGLMKGCMRAGPLLVRQDFAVSFDVASRIARCQLRIVPVSPEEYDAARLSAPNLCRPFMAAVGDLRSSRQLLRDRPFDVRKTIAKMKHTVDGKETLSELAAAIRGGYRDMAARARHFIRTGASPPSSLPSLNPDAGDSLSQPEWDGVLDLCSAISAHVESVSDQGTASATPSPHVCDSGDTSTSPGDEGVGICAEDVLESPRRGQDGIGEAVSCWFEDVDAGECGHDADERGATVAGGTMARGGTQEETAGGEVLCQAWPLGEEGESRGFEREWWEADASSLFDVEAVSQYGL